MKRVTTEGSSSTSPSQEQIGCANNKKRRTHDEGDIDDHDDDNNNETQPLTDEYEHVAADDGDVVEEGSEHDSEDTKDLASEADDDEDDEEDDDEVVFVKHETASNKPLPSSSQSRTQPMSQSSPPQSSTPLVRREVWIAFHRLEAAYKCVGDWGYQGKYLSHRPKYFDTKILGIFYNRSDANRCAKNYADRLGIYGNDSDDYDDSDDDDEDDDDTEEDFVGEGRFKDALRTGDVNTFSQRVYVERQFVQ